MFFFCFVLFLGTGSLPVFLLQTLDLDLTIILHVLMMCVYITLSLKTQCNLVTYESMT